MLQDQSPGHAPAWGSQSTSPEKWCTREVWRMQRRRADRGSGEEGSRQRVGPRGPLERLVRGKEVGLALGDWTAGMGSWGSLVSEEETQGDQEG